MEITEGLFKKGCSVKNLNKNFSKREITWWYPFLVKKKKGVFGLKIPKTPAEQASRVNSQ
jgi:hypothetical protein